MFRNKKKYHEDVIAAIKSMGFPSVDIEYRPCYANGRMALFHRWVNTANPALPKGVDASNEKARFFQHRSTTALIEYADGTMDRVWPQDIRFADGGRFKEYEWKTLEQLDNLKEH